MNNKSAFQLELDETRAQCGYDFMGLAMVQPAEYHYVIRWVYVSGNRNERYRRIVLRSGKGIAGIVFKTGKPLLIPSMEQYAEADSLFNYPIVQSEQLRSVVAVPIWREGRVEGVLLGAYRDDRCVTEMMLQQLTRQAQDGFQNIHGIEEVSP